MEIKIRKRRVRGGHLQLTPTEIDLLREACTGYGCFVDAARKVGLHKNTLRYIMDRGYGRKANIERIRIKIIGGYESSAY